MPEFRASTRKLSTGVKANLQGHGSPEVQTLVKTGRFEWLNVVYAPAHFLGIETDHIIRSLWP